MRSVSDRIRHALSFEIIGLLLVTPLGALAFHMPMHDIGLVSIVSATIATAWNFAYNYLFDVVLQRLRGTTKKTGAARVCHAVLFELGLLIVLMPFIAWYLGVSFRQAFVMDLSFAVQALTTAWLARNASDLEPGVVEVPAETDTEVARLELAALGVRIDALTPGQEAYLRSWHA